MDCVQIWIFALYEQAEQARKALLEAGFCSTDIALRLADDEAGPVAGNFTVGNLPIDSDRHTYARNYAAVSHGAQCLLSVVARNRPRAAYAHAIVARFGGRGGACVVP